MKEATLPDGGVKHAPEYEDCKAIAKSSGLPLREVYELVRAAIPEATPVLDHGHDHHDHGEPHNHSHSH